MFELTSIPVWTGFLVVWASAIGAGYLVYGAVLRMTAAGSLAQAERGRTTMLIALSALVLALAGFGLAHWLVEPAAALPDLASGGPPIHRIP